MTRQYTMQVSKEEMKEYGEFFKQMRLSIGLSKPAFGRLVGVNQATIRRWENAEVVPNRDIEEIEKDVRFAVKKYRTLQLS